MNGEKYSVDRVENGIAVLVDDQGDSHPVSLADLPEDIHCGDVVCLQDGVYLRDDEETQARRAYVLSLQQKLRRKKH